MKYLRECIQKFNCFAFDFCQKSLLLRYERLEAKFMRNTRVQLILNVNENTSHEKY